LQESAAKYVQLHPVAPDTPIDMLGATTPNLGIFVIAVFEQPQLTLPSDKNPRSKFVNASMEKTTVEKMLQLWTKATDKEAVYVQIGAEQMERIWGTWGRKLDLMLGCFDRYREKAMTVRDGKVLGMEELGVGEGLVNTEEVVRIMRSD